MLHTKFRENRLARSGEDFCIYHIWAWWPSWSCDPDFEVKFSPHYPGKLHIKFHFD